MKWPACLFSCSVLLAETASSASAATYEEAAPHGKYPGLYSEPAGRWKEHPADAACRQDDSYKPDGRAYRFSRHHCVVPADKKHCRTEADLNNHPEKR